MLRSSLQARVLVVRQSSSSRRTFSTEVSAQNAHPKTVQRPARSTTRKNIAKVFGIVLGMTGIAGAYRIKTDEGSRRSLAFWAVAGPSYAHYRWVDYRTKNASEQVRDRELNKLHDLYAPIAEELILRLRGFYLKQAQFVSTVDFFIPPQYLRFCKRMQNEVPTEFAPGEAEDVVCKNLGIQSIDEVFTEFQKDPLGSASIGQVHLARLKKTGELVAVKIMGRGVEARFRADIKTFIDFVKLTMPQHIAAMEEIQRQFATEFDYRGEAQNLLDVRSNILPHYSHKVYIPMPFMEYCTKEVLVMEYIPGPTLIKGIKQSFGEYAKQQGTTLEALEEEQKELMRRPDFKFRDIKEENRRMTIYNGFVKVRDRLTNLAIAAYNWTFVPVLRFKSLNYVESPQLLNLGAIIQTLADVHAWEVLKDGAFSCDPHPGNILLMPDGRLGLIDLGQFKRISKESRLYLAQTFVALANDDQVEVVRTLRRAGIRTKYNKSDVCYRLAAFWLDRNTKDITGGKNLQDFMDSMEAEDPSGGLPEELIMPGRVSVMMRALGNAFGLDLSVAKLWEGVAREVLEENGIKYIPKKSLATDIPDGLLS